MLINYTTWKKRINTYDVNSQESGQRGNISQHTKGHLQQTYN